MKLWQIDWGGGGVFFLLEISTKQIRAYPPPPADATGSGSTPAGLGGGKYRKSPSSHPFGFENDFLLLRVHLCSVFEISAADLKGHPQRILGVPGTLETSI